MTVTTGHPFTNDSGSEPDKSFWNGVEQCYHPGSTLSIDDSVRLHSDTAEEIDPITYEVIRYTLLNTNFEHGNLIQRLSVSPVVMTFLDFQSSILLEDGDLVFLGPNLQYFSNSQSYTAKWILENRSDNPGIADGDMFLSSDPFVGAPHQPDVCVAAPVFVDGKLFSWVANVMNHADVGGNTPGSFCLSAEDSWTDPPNFPPVKLVEQGELRSDVEEMYVRQSRMPAMGRMDLRAAVSGNHFAKQRILSLVERYGADVVKAVMRRVMDAGEKVFADRLASIPDGTWSHRAYTEVSLPGDRGTYRYQINIHKRGDRLYVDNEGTDAQVGSINCPYVAFVGSVLCALTQQLTSDLAGAYGGVYRRVTFEPVPGTLNCPTYPAAVSPAGAYTTEMNINIATHAVAKMMSCGNDDVRERILGPVHPHAYGVIYAGADEAGNQFIMINGNGLTGPGAGRPGEDGIDAGGQYWVPEAITYNVENVEAQYPVLYLHRKMTRLDQAGAGRHRGGPGFVECAVPHRAGLLQLQLYSNESFVKGAGLFGGNPNGRAWMRVRRDSDVRSRFATGVVPQVLDELGGDDEVTQFKGAPLDLGADDVFAWCFPSNAGYGDPLLRAPDEVLADVRSGRLGEHDAREAYGVVLEGGEVDFAATEADRKSRFEQRVIGAKSVTDTEGHLHSGRRVGDALVVYNDRFGCIRCATDLGSAAGNYKDSAVVKETAADEMAHEFVGGDSEIAATMVFREYFCGGCGLRLDSEISRRGDNPLWDLRVSI